MDDDTWRRVLAAALGPIAWWPVHWLVDRHRRKHAERDARLREEALRRATERGRRAGRWVRRALGFAKPPGPRH